MNIASTDDTMEFGSDSIVYCKSHMRPHHTGWCTVPVDGKTLLESTVIEAAYEECRCKGFQLYEDLQHAD